MLLCRKIAFTGKVQLMQHVMPSSCNFNSNQNNVRGTGIISPSSELSGIFIFARSHSAGVLDQTLVDLTE
jgi:hypothetical protein